MHAIRLHLPLLDDQSSADTSPSESSQTTSQSLPRRQATAPSSLETVTSHTRGRVRNTADREGWGRKLHQLWPETGMGRYTAWLQRCNRIRLALHLGQDSRHRFRLPDTLDGHGHLVPGRGYKGLQHKLLGHGLVAPDGLEGRLHAGGLARLGPHVLQQLLLFGCGTVCGDIEELGQLVLLDGAIKFQQLTHEVEVWGDGRPLVLDKLVGLLHG